MSSRRSRNDKTNESRRAKLLEAKKGERRRYAAYASVVALIVIVGVVVATAPPAPLQCFPDSVADKMTFDAKLFIWVGEPVPGPGAKFVYINYGIGRGAGCSWPVTTGPESPTCSSRDDWNAERCADWVMVHVASPVVRQYTLGDFFRVWSLSPGSNRTGDHPVCSYFGPDGVCGLRGPTFVSYNYGAWVPADPSLAFHPRDRIDIKVL